MGPVITNSERKKGGKGLEAAAGHANSRIEKKLNEVSNLLARAQSGMPERRRGDNPLKASIPLKQQKLRKRGHLGSGRGIKEEVDKPIKRPLKANSDQKVITSQKQQT